MVASVKVTAPARASTPRRAAALVTESGKRVELTWAPTQVTRGGLAGTWTRLGRPGRAAITQWVGAGQEDMSLTAIIGTPLGRGDVTPLIDRVVALGQRGERVRVNYSGFERGWWVIDDLSVTVTARNTAHKPSRAEVSITFGRWVQAPKRARRPGGKKGNRTYTVRKGDTLYRIARTLLGDGDRWKEIAKLNGIKTKPRRALKVGRKIKVPAR